MELDLKDLQERIRPAVEAVVGLTHTVDKDNSPVAAAVQADLHLSLFLLFAMDFVAATPTAVISGDAVEQLDDNQLRMVLPIPQMFESYYSMRLAKLQAGKMVAPEDTIVTPLGVSTDEENVVIAAEIGEQARGE